MSFCVLVHGGKETTQSQKPSTSKAASGEFTVIVMCYRVSFTSVYPSSAATSRPGATSRPARGRKAPMGRKIGTTGVRGAETSSEFARCFHIRMSSQTNDGSPSLQHCLCSRMPIHLPMVSIALGRHKKVLRNSVILC